MATDSYSGSPERSLDVPIHAENGAHLTNVIDEHDVVLLDFYADWCGPCRLLEPVLEDAATETSAVVAKVDVDEHPQLAGEYGVRGVPTLVLFDDGEQVEQHVGALPADRLRRLIGRYTNE